MYECTNVCMNVREFVCVYFLLIPQMRVWYHVLSLLCSNLRKHDPQETISGAFLQSCRVTLICLVTCACVCVFVCMCVSVYVG